MWLRLMKYGGERVTAITILFPTTNFCSSILSQFDHFGNWVVYAEICAISKYKSDSEIYPRFHCSCYFVNHIKCYYPLHGHLLFWLLLSLLCGHIADAKITRGHSFEDQSFIRHKQCCCFSCCSLNLSAISLWWLDEIVKIVIVKYKDEIFPVFFLAYPCSMACILFLSVAVMCIGIRRGIIIIIQRHMRALSPN